MGERFSGIGRHAALRLLRDGEDVVDVPPKLSARARMFATGQGRKTDVTDAHSVALVATRVGGLRLVIDDEQLGVLQILVDRRRSLDEDHTRIVSQLHQLLLDHIPGGANKDLSAAQAKALLATVRPPARRDVGAGAPSGGGNEHACDTRGSQGLSRLEALLEEARAHVSGRRVGVRRHSPL